MSEHISAPPARGLLLTGATFLVLALITLAVGAAAVLLVDQSPLTAAQELVNGVFGTRTNQMATLVRGIPIVICGIAAAFAFKAGLFNLGIEGQMVVGALAAAATAHALRDLPAPVLVPLTLIAGCAAGGLWALPTAWWQIRFGVPLMISTLLMNYIGLEFTGYLANFPLRDLTSGAAVAQTAMIPDAARLGILVQGTRLHVGVGFLVILPLATAWFFRRTALGYALRMTGLNPDFAAYGGIDRRRMMLLATAVSGATAGLAGAVQVMGVDFRFVDGGPLVTGGFAWTGFTAAILALSNPYGVLAAGLFLAALKVGATGMQRNTQIPLQIADIVQAAIIFVVAIRLRVTDLIGNALARLARR